MFNFARHNRPIARRLMLSVVMFSTMITIITSAYQLYGNYSRDVDAIHYRLNEIQQVHLSGLTTRLWTVDKTGLLRQMENILHLPDMIYLEIRENDEIVAKVGTSATDNVITRTYPMIYNHRGDDMSIGTLVAQATLDNVYQHIYDQLFAILISNGVKTFFVTGFILYLFYQLVTRHLDYLASYADKLNIHTLNKPLQLKRTERASTEPDELDKVVNAFNSMQKNLVLSINELRHSEAKVRLLLDSTAEAIFGIDSTGRCIFVNSACVKLLGYSHPTEILDKDMHSLIHSKYADGQPYPVEQCKIYKAFRENTHIYVEDDIFWNKAGRQIPVEYWSHPIIEDDKCVGAVVTFFDITEKQNNQRELNKYRFGLEQLVKERTHELEIANAELESFSYSVSHDLRAPLRSIDGFSLAILEDYYHLFDQEGQTYLNRIRHAAQRMGYLIDDLLSLSHVSKHHLNRSMVDLSKMTHTIMESLKETDKERAIELHVEDGLKIDSDPYLTEILMTNLLGNAWKYSSRRPVTSIEVGETIDQEQRIIYIKDNGTGFDMRYVEKLFKPFQRLHADTEFPGNGIGLATVERIVKRHGGRIWVDSHMDEGTTFYFSLDNHTDDILQPKISSIQR